MSIKRIVNSQDGEWHQWFAWLPVDTECGNRVWMESVERRWNVKKNFRVIDPYDPGDYDGGWDYRLFHTGATP